MTAEPYPPSPDESPFDALEGDLEQREITESLKLVELLGALHKYREVGQDMDENSRVDRDSKLGELAMAMGKGRFVNTGRNPRIAGCVYDEMVFWPNARSHTSVWIDRMFARFPKLSGAEYGLPDDAEVIPEDVLVEVYVRGGDIQRYVVNRTSGVVAYPDGEALDFDKDKLRAWQQNPTHEKPDVISVNTIADLVPTRLTPKSLRHMFTESKFREVDEDEDE